MIVEEKKEVKIFVPLFKSIFEAKWQKFVSYQPKSKKSWYKKGYPVGIWTWKIVWENEFWEIREYEKAFWTDVKANSNKKEWEWDVILTLKQATVDWTWKIYTIYLYKEVKWNYSYYRSKNKDLTKWWPKMIADKSYFISLFMNDNKEKPNDMTLILSEAEESTRETSMSTEEISFTTDNSWADIPEF